MIIQIYEVGSPTEAAAVADCGVDHIGMLVGNGAFPREIAPENARAIFAACPASATRVALSLSADLGEIAHVVTETRPDVLHLGAASELLPVAAVAAIKTQHPGLRLMRSIPVSDESAIALARDYDGIVDLLLLDSHKPGDPQIGALGITHDWSISRRIVEAVAVPCMLAGGLGPENVADAIAAVRPAGVDSKTRTDLPANAGKDIEAVRHFVAAARAAAGP